MTMETIRFGLELIIFIAIFVGIIYAGHKYASKKEVAEQTEREATRKAEKLAEQEARKAERAAEQAARKAENEAKEAQRKAERLAEQKARLLENIEKQALIMNNSLTHPRFKKIMEAHKANYYASLAQNATENVNAAFIALGDNVKNYLDDMPISSFLVKTKNNINIEVSAINCYSITYLLNI